MQKPLIKQIWHPYWKWEEIKYNMWGQVADHDGFLKKAILFTGNPKLYGSYMIKVTRQWPHSCEHNLTNLSQNRQAWIGHAAVALAFQCPEDIVREAWWHLTERQRKLANKEADKAIALWERNHVKIKKRNRKKRTRSRPRKG